MKAPQHTPGPWHLSFERHPHFNPVSPIPLVKTGEEGENSKQLAYVCQTFLLVEKEANARLIAAAHDMLAALVKLMEQYDSGPDFSMGGNLTNEPFLMARAALQKAGCQF